MKYKCLILDHDDTVVNSSQSIHYPAFLHTLQTLRPNLPPISFEDFNHHCFVYGFYHLCTERYQFNEEEMEIALKELNMTREELGHYEKCLFRNII